MPSADFCAAVRPPYGRLSPVAGTQRRPPEVRPTAFAARPPDLPPRPLMTPDFAITCSLVRSGRPLYPVLVHRAAALLRAFFRPHLATAPLRFANPSPSSGWIEDFHLQAVVHTRHTRKCPRLDGDRGRLARRFSHHEGSVTEVPVYRSGERLSLGHSASATERFRTPAICRYFAGKAATHIEAEPCSRGAEQRSGRYQNRSKASHRPGCIRA
jgi:hypothetical protein